MKMNSQSKNFARRVQVDLLALDDANLFRTIHHWVDGKDASGISHPVSEDTRLALGYTRIVEMEASPLSSDEESATTDQEETRWQPPVPEQLRSLLTAMDVHMFSTHVITPAFHSLHASYPEWYEGMTFNAHLANYLRKMSLEATKHKQKA